MRGVTVVLSLALAMGAAGPAEAQLRPCSGVTEPGLKILLDDIARSGGAPSPFVDLLTARLEANLEQLRVEAGLTVKVLRCAKRLPGSPAAFTRPLVQDLNARQVVLEVWGTTAEVEADGETYHEASIGYVLVPIRFHEFAAAQPPGAFVVPRRAKSLATPDDLVQLVDQAGALAAYAATGAGTRLARARQYDAARVQLCKAQTAWRARHDAGRAQRLAARLRPAAGRRHRAGRARRRGLQRPPQGAARERGGVVPGRTPVMQPRAVRCAMVAAGLLLATRGAQAGAVNIACSAPIVFSGAAVNVVVLPYSVPPELGAASREVGTKLAALVQQELLLAIAKYGSVGAVQLVDDAGRGGTECTPEAVLAKLLQQRPGARDVVGPGRGLVLVWGRVFRSGDALLLQSFVQFLRRDADETLAATVASQPFSVRLGAQAFACVPRRVSMSDLASVAEQYARTRVIHDAPDEASPGHPVPQDQPLPYWVQAARGDWLQIQSQGGGPSGWILARVDRAAWSLRTRMPELSFVEGVTGYLRYRVGTARPQAGDLPAQVPGGRPGAGVLDAAAAAIAAYQREWREGAVIAEAGGASAPAAGGQPLAIAVPAQVAAFVTLLRDDAAGVALQEAAARIDRAVALLPHSADLRNLSVLLRLRAAAASPAAAPAVAMPLVGELQAALAAEPTNGTALANLRSLCRLLLAAPGAAPPRLTTLTAEERDEVQRQLDALEGLGG